MRPDAPLLAFDTSAAHCAAAVFSDGGFSDGGLSGGRLLLSRTEPMATGQSERLMPFLLDFLKDGGLGWRDLSRIAVGTGPGNFTGVRIAVASARGLALGLGIPSIGVDRFAATALGLDGPLLVALDARQGRVALRSGDSLPILLDPDEVLPPDLAALPVVGDGAGLLGPRAAGPRLSQPVPLTEAIARIAAALPLPQPRPAPVYLRPADAAPARDAPPRILT